MMMIVMAVLGVGLCVLVVVMFVVFFVKCLLYAPPAECSGREALEESWSAF